MNLAKEMLKEWLAFAEDKFGEFDGDEPDCDGESLCPKCESSGCIQRKMRETRKLIETLK
jgi:hypothetical protein